MDEPATSGISATVRLTVTIGASAEQVQAAMNETGEAALPAPTRRRGRWPTACGRWCSPRRA